MTIQEQVNALPESEREQISDGYHTFKELYEHRVTLFVALCNQITRKETKEYLVSDNSLPMFHTCWKAKQHSDGTMWDGFFIAGIGTDPGNTLTYHLPMSEWDNIECFEVGHSPEWDGHTSSDVLRMLKNL